MQVAIDNGQSVIGETMNVRQQILLPLEAWRPSAP